MNRKLIILFSVFMIGLLPFGNLSIVAESVDVKTIQPHQSSTLTIVTRHDSNIYTAFAKAFVQSSYAQEVGITSESQINFLSGTTFDAFSRAMTNPSFGVSLGWGGGPTLFNSLAEIGAVSPISDPDVLAAINDAVEDTLAGAEMKHYNGTDLVWAANAISSFGFTVNNKVLQERNLTKPKTWEDLASPDFFTSVAQPNIGMGNAPGTTSNTRIYQIILQKFGWERGWEILYQMAGNGKIYDGSVETRASVINGETAVAMTIDFYGVIAMRANPDTEYIVPANASIVNGDPIALAKTPQNPAAANAFLKFLFSKEGQSVWLQTSINRLPIRVDAFDTEIGKQRTDLHKLYNETLANQGITFNETLALSLEEPMRFHFESTITDVHNKLRDTWGLMINTWKNGNITDTVFETLRKDFGKPAMTQQDAIDMNDQFNADQSFRRNKQSEWLSAANAKLDAIREELSPFISENTQVTDVSVHVLGVLFGLLSSFVTVYQARKIRRQ